MEKELQRYFEFISQYDKKEINPPDTVVFLEKTRNIYENGFINVKLIHKKDDIYFMDNLDDF